MKRFLAVLLLAVTLLSACGGSHDYGVDGKIITEIQTACEKLTSLSAYKARLFVLEMKFSREDAILMSAQGSYEAEFTGQTPYVSSTFSRKVLGNSSGVKVLYRNGVSTTTVGDNDNEKVYKDKLTPEEFFGNIIYVKPFVPDNKYIKGIDKLESTEGKGYKVYLDKAEDVLYPLIGDDIYETAMINNPKYDMMNIQKAYISYIIDESSGRIKDFVMSFTLNIYDTPPYYPGKKPNYEDYKLDIRVSFRVVFEQL